MTNNHKLKWRNPSKFLFCVIICAKCHILTILQSLTTLYPLFPVVLYIICSHILKKEIHVIRHFFLLLTHNHSLLSLSNMLGAKGDLLKPVDKVCSLQWSNWKSINRHEERKWNIFINTGEMHCWIWDKRLPDDYLNLLYLD